MMEAIDSSKLPDRSAIADHYVIRNLTGGLRLMIEDKAAAMYLAFLILVLLLGVFGPYIAPYEATEINRAADGSILIAEAPSVDHPLGTNDRGQDVFSRMIIGARPTVITGLLGGGMIIGIGMTIGVTSGFIGGRTDDALMRITDLFYGIPLIPVAIILVALFGIGFFSSIMVIGAILWRSNARVLRSQVLQIRERPFVIAAEAMGSSRPRIILKHILPNVAPMAVLFFALGVGVSILVQATLSFLGVVDPFMPSWGVIVRNAYSSGRMASAWWWSIPSGLMISLTVLSTFMFGRSYEKIAGQGDDEAFVQR